MFNRRLSTEVDSAARVDVAALVSIVKFSFADAAVDVIQRTDSIMVVGKGGRGADRCQLCKLCEVCCR